MTKVLTVSLLSTYGPSSGYLERPLCLPQHLSHRIDQSQIGTCIELRLALDVESTREGNSRIHSIPGSPMTATHIGNGSSLPLIRDLYVISPTCGKRLFQPPVGLAGCTKRSFHIDSPGTTISGAPRMGANKSGSERSWSPFGRLASRLINIKKTSGSRATSVLLGRFVPVIGLDLHDGPH